MNPLAATVLIVCVGLGLVSVFTATFPPDPCTLNATSVETVEVNSAVGITLAVGASLVNSFGLFTQKIAHDQSRDYFSNPLWWVGFAGITCAEVLNAVAYGYAPAPVVSCIGSLTILANAGLAVVFLKERLQFLSLLGMVAIASGIVVLILGSPSTSNMYTPQQLVTLYLSPATLTYASFSVLTILSLAFWKTVRYNLVRLVVYASLVSSWTVVAVRGVLSFLFMLPTDCSRCGCTETLRSWLFWLLLATILLSAWWGGGVVEQEGLRKYSQTKWVPLHFCACFFSFTVASVTVFDEWSLFTGASVPLLLFGIVICTCGIVLVTEVKVTDCCLFAGESPCYKACAQSFADDLYNHSTE